MKIAHKLLLGILISLVMTVTLGVISYSGVKIIDNKFNELVQFPIPSIERLSSMTENFTLSVEEAHSYRLYGLLESKEEYFRSYKEFQRLMDELKKELHYGTPDILAEDTKLIDSISEKTQYLNKLITDDFIDYEQTNKTVTGNDPFAGKKDEIVTLLHQYIEMEKGEIASARIEVDRATKNTTEGILLSSFVILIATIIINGMLAKSIIGPLSLLGEMAAGLGKGDFNKRVEKITSQNEIGVLAGIFNTMADNVQRSHSDLEMKVKERTAALEKVKTGLEDTVKERTAALEKTRAGLEETVELRTTELQDKLTEIERINKLMTGREMKMVELKSENEKLKNKQIKKIG